MLGVAAVVLLGVHALAERFDDYAFAFFLRAAGTVEDALIWLSARRLEQPEIAARAIAGSVEIARLREASIYFSLVVQLLLALWLVPFALGGWPSKHGDGGPRAAKNAPSISAFLHRRRGLGGRALEYCRFVSMEKLYLPAAISITVVAATTSLYIALDNAFFALATMLPAGSRATSWLSPLPAMIASAIVFWRLGLTAVGGSLASCQLACERDERAGEAPAQRLLRGLVGAVLVMPLVLLGFLGTSPVPAWILALWRSI